MQKSRSLENSSTALILVHLEGKEQDNFLENGAVTVSFERSDSQVLVLLV